LMMNAQQLRSNVEWNTTKENERLLDFVMAHQSVLFQVNKICLKSDCGSSNAKRKSWQQSFDCLGKKSAISWRKPKSLTESSRF
jgi:hypothetical protein